MTGSSCPLCGKKLMGVQYGRYYDPVDYPYHYDGVSEYRCTACPYRRGRWCGKQLRGKEVEPRFCDDKKDHPVLP